MVLILELQNFAILNTVSFLGFNDGKDHFHVTFV